MAGEKENRSAKTGRVCVDPAKCVGCASCMVTCAMVHTGRFSMSAAHLYIEKHDDRCEHIPRICLQCAEAVCRDACPAGAIGEGDNGFLRVDASLCTGCGLCEETCPERGIRLAKLPSGDSIALKCDRCDGEAWCAKVCVVGALRFE